MGRISTKKRRRRKRKDSRKRGRGPNPNKNSNFGNNENKEWFFNSGRVTQIQEKTSRSFEVYITS